MKAKKLFTLLTAMLFLGIGNIWAQTSWMRLDSIDFTNTTTWPAATYLSSSADVKTTVNGVYFWAKKGSKALKVNDGVVGVDFGTQNMSSNGQHGIAIPVTGVNGSLKVIVYHDYNNTSASFKVGIAHATDNDPAGTQTWDQAPGNSGTKNKDDFVSTKTGLTGAEYIVWVGENGSSYTHFKKVAIYTEAPTGYSVTYVENGHGANQTDLTGQTNLPATLPTLSETGWIFEGWYTDNGTFETPAVPGATLTANATLYAKWTEDSSVTKYEITYDLNGASGSAPTQEDVAEGTSFNLASAPTWAGHAFDGWLCSIDGVTYAAGASYTMTAAATTFTAQWHELDCKIYSFTGGIGSAEGTAGDYEVTASALILKNSNARIKLTPAPGETFKAGDLITISGYTGNAAKKFGVYVKNAAGSSNIATAEVANLGEYIASATLSADAEYVFLARKEGTTMNILTCEVHRSCAEGAAAGLSYATAAVEKTTGEAAFTNPLTNTNGLVIAGYSSSDVAVATVDANGQVTIIGDGTATITAYSAVQTNAGTLYAAGTASYTITVTSADDDATLSALSVSGLTLSPAFASATEDYTATKEYGAADPTVADVTATPTSGAANAEVVWDGTNHKFVITVTAGDNTTTKTYNITINEAEAKRGLLTVPFSNGAKGAINAAGLEIRVPYIGASEPTVVLANIEYQSGVSGASAAIEAGKLRITGADSNYDDYTLTFVQLTPSALTLDELVTFDAVPSYAFAPYGWDADKGVKFAKNVEEASNHRVSLGNTRVYFAIQDCDEVQLTSGSGGARDVKIYVNGVLSSVTKTAASGSAIKLALDNSQANFIAIESNQTGGDGGFTKILVKTLAANTLAYDDGAYTTGDAALDLSTLISTYNSDAAITYAVKTDGGTNASISGNNFTATAAGTAVITATQVASETIRQASVDFNVVVTAGATKYTVTFDAQGGSTVDPQEVTEGGSPAEPTAPTKDEYIFKGWAESAGASVSDVVDVTSFTINAPKIFYAIWEAEPAGIKLLDGSTVNHTNFITGVTAEKVTISEVEYDCVKFSGTVSSVTSVKDLTRVIAYNATTNQTKIKLSLYNTSTSSRTVQVKGLVEGATEAVNLAAIELGNKEKKVSDWIEFNNAANRTIYIFIGSSAGDVRFLQVKVIEDGATPMKQAGEAGYSLNFNKGRFFGVKDVTAHFEGLDVEVKSSDCQPLNTSVVKLLNSSISFTVADPLTLTVTTNNNKTYYVTKDAAGTDNETAVAGASIFDLTAGTWFVTGGASNVEITNIAFSAPRVDRTITFDSNGGSSVADIVVKDGEVATAPTDPTKDDNDFAGWYNGSDLYDWTAPVTSDLNLTAHWTAHVNNDATLKSLSYGSTAITLEDGVLTYNVNLPALTLAVPALTAEPNAALAIADVTDAADFDGDGKATSSVLVTAEDGTTQLTYTVNFTKAALLPQVNVTANTIWDWANIASENITLVGRLKNYECVLANVEGVTNDATFNSQALLFCGERVRSVESSRTFASIGHISFNVTVPGKVTVEFSDNGTNNRRIKINDEQSDASSSKTDVKTFEANVAAGTVTIMGISNDGSSTNQYVRISRIEFEVASAPTPETVRTGLEVGRYYTICLPKKVVAATGATFWSMSERNTDTENPLAYIVEENLPLTAGQPFLFQATATTLEVTYEGEATTAGSHGALHGTLDAMDQGALDLAAGANTLYILKNNELRLASGRTGNSLPANRAYIIYEELDPVSTPSHAPGRQVRSMPLHKDVATGLDDLNADNQAQKVLLNGQLFIIRGEKMYDATGILVK